MSQYNPAEYVELLALATLEPVNGEQLVIETEPEDVPEDTPEEMAQKLARWRAKVGI